MEVETIKKFINKKIFLRTINSRTYSGKIIKIINNDITLLDNRGLLVALTSSDISEIKEEF